jgi:D-alanyl-D-alanine carboxypeptidase
MILILTFYVPQLKFFDLSVNAGELDETLKRLLSAQQSRHKESGELNKIKSNPQTIEELFASRQGIITGKSSAKKIGASKRDIQSKVKKTEANKNAETSSEEKNETESLEDILTSQSIVVLDEGSGNLMYSRNPFKKMAPASLTKIMTAIALLDANIDLNETITIKHDIYVRSDGVSLGLKKGDKTTLMDLLYMSLLHSANDACIAIAEEVAGSVPKFAKLMNKQAKEIGALNTHFVNPNGMPDDRHYSTAYDLAILSGYAMKNPVFAKIVGTKKYQVKIITQKEVAVKSSKTDKNSKAALKSSSKKNSKVTAKLKTKEEVITKLVEVTRTINLTNRHKLLGKTPGVKGIKTGYTRAAGRCLSTAYSYDEKQMIIIVLKARDVVSDTVALIDCDKYLNASNIALKSSAEKPAALSGSAQQKTGITLSTISVSR